MIELKNKDCKVGIDAGELVSYVCDNHEFIHQKGSPGWGSSDKEMFPIIGPLDKANLRIHTPTGKAVQDQHVLLMHIPYELITKYFLKEKDPRVWKYLLKNDDFGLNNLIT